MAHLLGNLSGQLYLDLRDMSLLDVEVVAFGEVERIITFQCSQHVLASSCYCSRYQVKDKTKMNLTCSLVAIIYVSKMS